MNGTVPADALDNLTKLLSRTIIKVAYIDSDPKFHTVEDTKRCTGNNLLAYSGVASVYQSFFRQMLAYQARLINIVKKAVASFMTATAFLYSHTT